LKAYYVILFKKLFNLNITHQHSRLMC